MKGTGPVGPLRPPRGARLRVERLALTVVTGLWTAVALSACTGRIGGQATGSDETGSGAPGTGNSRAGTGGGGTANGSGTAGDGTGTAGASGTGSGGSAPVDCSAISPGRAPIRRLTTYEYSNTVRDLLNDTSSPGNALPPQVDSAQNLFGNDADEQAPSPFLIEQYQTVAQTVAATATASTAALAKLNSCASTVTAATESACARAIATTLAPRAFRRVAAASDIDNLVSIYTAVRGFRARSRSRPESPP